MFLGFRCDVVELDECCSLAPSCVHVLWGEMDSTPSNQQHLQYTQSVIQLQAKDLSQHVYFIQGFIILFKTTQQSG
jgi:hypothetical protein